MVWQHISPEVTVRDFRKCCISSAMDGTVMRMGMLGRWRHWLCRWIQQHWMVKA